MDEVNGSPKNDHTGPDAPEDVKPLSLRDPEEKPELEASQTNEDAHHSNSFKAHNAIRFLRAIARCVTVVFVWVRENFHDCLMVLFTGILTYVAVQQFKFNKASSGTSTHQIDKIIDAADRIEDAANSFSGSAEHINVGIKGAVEKLNIEATKMAVLAENAGKQATFTDNLATQATQDRRPWVGIRDIECDCWIDNNRVFNIRRVIANFANTGKTPATNMTLYLSASPAINENDIHFIEKFMGTTPTDEGVVPPYGVRPVALISATIAFADIEMFRGKRIYLRGKITYSDTIDKSVVHTTEFCVINKGNAEGKEFRYCPIGNTMD